MGCSFLCILRFLWRTALGGIPRSARRFYEIAVRCAGHAKTLLVRVDDVEDAGTWVDSDRSEISPNESGRPDGSVAPTVSRLLLVKMVVGTTTASMLWTENEKYARGCLTQPRVLCIYFPDLRFWEGDDR